MACRSGDVSLDLAAKTEHETAVGGRLQVPSDLRQGHRIAGECHGDACAELHPARLLGSQHERQERVVRSFQRPYAVEPLHLQSTSRRARDTEITFER